MPILLGNRCLSCRQQQNFTIWLWELVALEIPRGTTYVHSCVVIRKQDPTESNLYHWYLKCEFMTPYRRHPFYKLLFFIGQLQTQTLFIHLWQIPSLKIDPKATKKKKASFMSTTDTNFPFWQNFFFFKKFFFQNLVKSAIFWPKSKNFGWKFLKISQNISQNFSARNIWFFLKYSCF